MIRVSIFRNNSSQVYGFSVKNHGDPIVCSAVSILTFNTVNSIEAFTKEKFVCDIEQEGGYLFFEVTSLKNNQKNHDVTLLLDALVLGLCGIQAQYNKEIKIVDEEVHPNVKN